MPPRDNKIQEGQIEYLWKNANEKTIQSSSNVMIKTCEKIIKNQEVGNDEMGFKDVGWENLDKILMEKYMKSPLYRLNSLAVAEEGSATHTDGHATSRQVFSSGMADVKMKEMSRRAVLSADGGRGDDADNQRYSGAGPAKATAKNKMRQ